mmetsp:Transcript_13040/g.23930  ORF Transcript_13040/g.23930 Transcript_13040/m.23930 type:complete len:227 (-) Transcript_13040:99-779(-)
MKKSRRSIVQGYMSPDFETRRPLKNSERYSTVTLSAAMTANLNFPLTRLTGLAVTEFGVTELVVELSSYSGGCSLFSSSHWLNLIVILLSFDKGYVTFVLSDQSTLKKNCPVFLKTLSTTPLKVFFFFFFFLAVTAEELSNAAAYQIILPTLLFPSTVFLFRPPRLKLLPLFVLLRLPLHANNDLLHFLLLHLLLLHNNLPSSNIIPTNPAIILICFINILFLALW